MNRLQRKVLCGCFTGCTAVAVAASSAYACVAFKGQAQVNVTDPSPSGGTPQNSGTFEAFGSGANGHAQYCDSGATSPGWDSSAEARADGGDVLTVSVGASACTMVGGASSSLMSGTNYTVIVNNPTSGAGAPFTFVNNGSISVWSMRASTGCFFGSTGQTGNKTLATNFSINTSGVGSGIYTLPSVMNRSDTLNANAASSLCVGRRTDSKGIFVPLKIESTI